MDISDENVIAEYIVPMAFNALAVACRTYIERTTNESVDLHNALPAPEVSGLSQYIIHISDIPHLGEIRLRQICDQHTEIAFFAAIAPPHPAQWEGVTDSLGHGVRTAIIELTYETIEALPTSSPIEREAMKRRRARYERRKNEYDTLCARILTMQDQIFNGLIRRLNRDINEIAASRAAIVPSPVSPSPSVQPKQKQKDRKPRGPNSDTLAKLDALRERRKLPRNKRGGWMTACQKV